MGQPPIHFSRDPPWHWAPEPDPEFLEVPRFPDFLGTPPEPEFLAATPDPVFLGVPLAPEFVDVPPIPDVFALSFFFWVGILQSSLEHSQWVKHFYVIQI